MATQTETSKASTTSPAPANPRLALGRQLLQQFETSSAFERLEEQVALIEELELGQIDDQGVIVSANTAMDGVKLTLTLEGLEGSNEAARKASLDKACQDNPLYMRAIDELASAKTRLAAKEVAVAAAKRRYAGVRLEIEARISSKNLLAATL